MSLWNLKTIKCLNFNRWSELSVQSVASDQIVKFYRLNLKRYSTSDFIISQMRLFVVPLIDSRSDSLH